MRYEIISTSTARGPCLATRSRRALHAKLPPFSECALLWAALLPFLPNALFYPIIMGQKICTVPMGTFFYSLRSALKHFPPFIMYSNVDESLAPLKVIFKSASLRRIFLEHFVVDQHFRFSTTLFPCRCRCFSLLWGRRNEGIPEK